MKQLFSIQNIAFSCQGYQMSWLELLGAATGLWSVWLLARERVAGFPIGIVSVVLLAALFFQLALYADMFLQGYFFVTCFYGWHTWLHPHATQSNQQQKLIVRTLPKKTWLWLVPSIFITTQILSYATSHLHIWWPKYFVVPASWPLTNAFMMAVSLAAEWILAQKYLENWYMWLVVDIIATYVYFQSGTIVLSLEYLAFTIISIQGIRKWRTSLQVSQ